MRCGSFDKQYLAHIEYMERQWVAIETSAEAIVDSSCIAKPAGRALVEPSTS